MRKLSILIVGIFVGSLITYSPQSAITITSNLYIGVSADRGDTSPTIQIGVDSPIQKFATTLTANRTITLSTTGAYNGAQFKIVRSGLGAFTLNVGGLKTVPSLTAAAIEVTYDGSAWILTGYDLL